MQKPADVVVHPAIKHVPRSVISGAYERIVRCGLRIVPVGSETENKFEDAMEVTASSPLPELARVLVPFDHVASFIPKRESQHDVSGCKTSRIRQFRKEHTFREPSRNKHEQSRL
jgi:hypothetical protein